MSVELRRYKSNFDRGRAAPIEVLWGLVGLLFSSQCPGSAWRAATLRLFGAKIGKDCVFKPGVRIKFPWRLRCGNYSWIGECCWIDNLAQVNIGNNVCISQGVYICTGNHDWGRKSFDLRLGSVTLEDGSWIGAMSRLAPGVTVGRDAVVALGSVITESVGEANIVAPAPFVQRGVRKFRYEADVEY